MEVGSIGNKNMLDQSALESEDAVEDLIIKQENAPIIEVPLNIKQEDDVNEFINVENDIKCEMDDKNYSIDNETDVLDFHTEEHDEIGCEMDVKNFSLDVVPTEDVMNSSIKEENAPIIAQVPLDIKQEADVNDFLSGENDIKCEMDFKNYSIDNESDVRDFHTGEKDEIECEMDVKIFSLDVVPTEVVMGTRNISDDKLKIDKNSKYQANHTQENFVKCIVSDDELINKDMEDSVDGTQSDATKFQCHNCKFSSTRKGCLDRHINEIHLKIKAYQCDFCDYTSSRKFSVKYHINSVHRQLKTFMCHLCKFSSVKKEYLQEHIDALHLKIKKFKCHLCEYGSRNSTHLRDHIDGFHLKLKKYKCDLCAYSAAQKSQLQGHINRIHLKLKK